MPATPYSQFIWINHGTNTDEAIKYANESGDTTASNFATGGPTGTNTGIVSPWSIVADLPGGFYYIIDPEFTGNGTADGQIHLGFTATPTVAPTTVYTVPDHSAVPNKFGEANAIAIDNTNHILYLAQVVYNNSLDGLDNAQTGIVSFTYNPTTGALSAPTAVVTRTGGLATDANIDEVKQLSLDTVHNVLYFTDDTFGKGTFVSANETNSVKAYNTVTHVETTVVTFPSASDTNVEYPPGYTNGTIYGVAADPTDNIVFFSTASGFAGSEALNKIYVILPNGTGQVLLTESATYNNMAPFSLTFDDVHNKLYVSYETTNNTAGHLVVYDVNIPTPGSTAGITLSNPLDINLNLADPTPDGADYPLNGFLDQLPALTTSGTTTHAAEQDPTKINLLTAPPTITDSDNDHLASAYVQITGGTFVSNETSANDDHLSVLDGVTSKTSGTFSGTNITIAYDSATEKLTLTGYDTLANYATVLSHIQYTTTGDNPTNYGNNPTRTVTWHTSDGALNDPSGTNETTTTLNLDAVNDAPVNHLPATPTVNEDVQTPITGISITDVDADPANQDITVTFSLLHGTLNVLTGVAGGITGADITGGAQNTNTIAITATQNQINATIAGNGLRYTSDLNFNSGFGTETLHIVTSDNGHTDSAAFPGAQGDTDNLTITVAAVNDNPNLQPDTTTPVSYTENAVPTALFAGENVDTPLGDVDQSANYAGGSIDLNITAGLVTGDRIDLTGARFVIVAGNIQDTANGNAVVGTINATNATSHVTISALTANATPSVVDALIQAFGFDSTSDNPGSGDRTVTLTFNDGGNTGSGGALTDAVTQTVHVTAVNDAPVSTTPVAHYTATEQVNLNLHGTGLSVSDVDGNSGSETVTLSVVQGIITLSAGNSGVGSISGSGTSSLTFSGTLTQLNALLSGSSTGTLIYNDPSDTPAASTTLTLLIHDNGNTGTGGDLTDSDTATIDITAVNDAPNAFMATDPYAATENVAVSLKNTGMTVSDIDALGAVEVATMSVTQGVLNITAGTSGVTVGTNGTSSVTLTGTLAQINALLNTDGTSSVSYTETNDNPSATVTLTLQINDQGNTGTGGALIGTDTSTINITAANDAPVATTPVAHYTATEQVNLNLHGTGLSVSDVDGNSGSETVTLSVVQGIITLSAGNSGVGSISGSGTSSVTFSGTLTQLNALLSGSSTGTLIYNNPSDTPAASTTLTLLIHDNGNTGGGDLTANATATIDITAVNDTPNAFMATDPYAATENVAVSLKNTGMTVSDVDALGAVEVATLSVTQGVLNITAGTSGVTVGTNGTSSVTLTGTLAQINALLNTDGTSSVSYTETNDNPSATVTLTLQINDQGNTGTGGALIGTDTSTINITAANDAPVATITPASYSATENITLNLKTNGLSVSDVDGNSGSETVTLSVTEGTLHVLAGTSGAAVSGDNTSSVTITGTIAQINALLQTDGTSVVQYTDANDTPSATATLTLAIHDNGNTGGGDLSASDTATINITAQNDAPVATITPTTYSATENITLNLKTNGLSVSDVDGGPPGSETVTLSVTEGTLTVAAGSSGAGVSGSGTNSATITGTIAQINALLNTDGTSVVQYTDTNDNPSATATLTLLIHDNGNSPSGDLSASDTATINITAQNDAPVSTITPTSYGGAPNVAINLKNNGLAVSDVDGNAGSETVTLSVTSGTLTVTTGGSGAGVAGSGTSSVTITGTIAQINALLNTDGTSTVSFVDSVGGTKTLTLLIHDNGNTGGGDLSAQDTAQIILDNPPVVDLNGAAAGTGATLAYIENGAAAAIAPAGITTDVDSADFNGGALRVSFSANGAAEDQLSILTDGTVTVSSGTVSVGGLAVGTVSGGTNGADLLVTFNTTDATPSTVSTLIEHIGYANNSDNPSLAARTVTFLVDDGDGASGTANATINITGVNDAPVSTITPTTYSATEQTALSLKNNGLAVSDVDGNAGSETVTLSVTEGTLTVTTGGSGAGVAGSGTASVTITGTIAQINALLNTDGTSTVSYIDNTDDPSASATLTLLIHDNGNTGTGGDHSASDTATINIAAVNDAPGLANVPATGDYTENAAAVLLAPSILITDPDPFPHGAPGGNGLILLATAKIASGFVAGDRLLVDDTSDAPGPQTSGFYTGINVQWNYDATTHILSLFSADPPTNSGDTIVDFDHVLQNVYFDSTSDDPTNGGANNTRTLQWQIQDKGGTANGGTDLSAIYTTTLTVHATNDAPAAAITPTSYSATEQTALSLKNNGIAVSDVDGGAGSETVTLSVGEGVLNVTTGGSGAGVAGSGTNSVTITGTVAQINALLNTDGTSTVSYIDNTDTPGASTTLSLLIHDNGNTGTGGDLSSTDTATINITAVNDAPQLTGFGDSSSFVENGGSVLLDTVQNAAVSDAELNVSPNKYAGATLTIARNGGANSDDSFVGTGTLDLADVSGTGENVSLDGGTTFIGTFTDPGDGSLSFTFNANATAANVNSVMRQIAYSNGSDNPPTSVQIDFTLRDGNGQPGGQAQGTGATPGVAVGSFTVNITQVDDAPVLINVAPSAAYSPGSPGVELSSGLGVFDVDATAPSTLQGIHNATVSISSGFFAGDQLFVNLPTSGGFFIVDDGSGPVVTNISVTSNAAGTMVLGGTDTTQHYQLVLDTVNYRSTAADPSNGGVDPTRNISWQVNDGALNSQTPNPDPNNLVNVTVLHFDTAPTVDLDASGPGTGFTTTFTENGAAIAIADTDLSIVDPDTANLDSATIVLTNAKAGDSLSIAGALPAGIDSTIDTSVAGKITLRLLNSATLADYQTAVGQIRFSNSSDAPDATDRDITVFVSETDIDSNTAHATVHVVAVNDAPVNTVPGGPMNISPTTGNVTITGLSIADPDAGSGTMSTILSVGHGTLTVSAAGGATVLGSGSNAVTVTGTLSALNATLLASGNVLYHADTGFAGVDTLKMVTNDGGNSGIGGPLTDTDQLFINDIGQGALAPNGQLPGNIQGNGVLVYHSPVDFNHDGNGDLLLRHTSGPLAAWELNGPVKIADQVISPLGNDWHVAAKNDFNGDGKTDILLRHDNGTIALWTMNGTQKAADQVVSPLGNDWHVAATNDFNGDGKSDILLRHDNGTIALWTMNGATKVADQVVSPLGNDWHITDTADFNGDGKSDILLRHDNGTVALWTMSGATKVADQVIGPETNDWHFLATADFNGDGKADILWRNDNGSVELWTMNGASKIADQVVSQMGNDWHYLGVGDFNADGKADILWRHDNGTVAVWEMNNGQKLADQVVSPLGNDWHFAGLTDANNDHMTDILWRHDDGTVALWQMNGTHKQVDQVVSHLGNDWVLT